MRIIFFLLLISISLYSQTYLTVKNNSPYDRFNEVASGTLSIPEQFQMKSIPKLRIIDQFGTIVPAQFRVLSRWKGLREDPTKNIKFIEVDLMTSIRRNSTSRYAVENGEGSSGNLKVSNIANQIDVKIFDSIYSFNKSFFGTDGIGIQLIDENKNELFPEVSSTVIEKSGSVISTILQRGSFKGSYLTFSARWIFEFGLNQVKLDLTIENNHGYGELPNTGAKEHQYFESLSLIKKLPVDTQDSKYSVINKPLQTAPFALVCSDQIVAIKNLWQNYPKALSVSSNLLKVDLWPEEGSGPIFGGQYWYPPHDPDGIDAKALKYYRFEGGRWKTHSIIFDKSSKDSLITLNKLEDPLLVRTDLSWPFDYNCFGQLITYRSNHDEYSDDRYERMVDILVDDSRADNQSTLGQIGLPKFISRGGTYGVGPDMYGWSNFGDLAWGDGYSSLHYDFVWGVLINWFRTGDQRFYQLGLNMADHKADYDQLHSIGAKFRGLSFYEKGYSHGNAENLASSHTWVNGTLLAYLCTGDERYREAAIEAGEYIIRSKPDTWDGWWGSRIQGWRIEALVHLWNVIGDQRYIDLAKKAIDRWQFLEGGNGSWNNPGSLNMIPGSPIHEQTWMHAIVLSAIGKYVYNTGDKSYDALIQRMSDWLINTGIRYNEPGKVSVVWTRADRLGWKAEPSIHHCWCFADALSYAGVILNNQSYRQSALQLWESVTRYHQYPAASQFLDFSDSSKFSVIAARMMNFPNSETKILSNIALWSHAPYAMKKKFIQ